MFENRLERDFLPVGADQVYAGDITYIWTQAVRLYLAVLIDLYSRKVVGWLMGKRLTSTLVCDALRMALWRRRPPKGQLIHHSDRGVQYASRAFRGLLKAHGIAGSMSRKGDCWHNAVVESFFGSLKSERVHWRSYLTREDRCACPQPPNACNSSRNRSVPCTRCSPACQIQRSGAWEEIEQALQQFENGHQFEGPCEMLIAVGTR